MAETKNLQFTAMKAFAVQFSTSQSLKCDTILLNRPGTRFHGLLQPCQQLLRAPLYQSYRTAQTSRRPSIVTLAMERAAGTREIIPIFPLGLVALPQADVPLQIFEARYRVLFSTLLAGEEGIEDGLVNPDKSWAGTRRFGMCLSDSQGIASIGTALEIKSHALLDDGRLLVQNVGKERFKILDVVEQRPVLVCEVEYLDDEERAADGGIEEKELASKAGELFRSVVQLSVKLKETELPEEVANPEQLRDLSPRDLSFWMTALIADNPYQQQVLLEEECTIKRLKAINTLLEETLKYLSARSALQSAFTGGEETTE